MADRKAKMKARLQQKSRAMNLKYAADALRCDRKVVITACLNHPGALIYCLDDKLRAELTGLSRKKLEELLETADVDMLPKLDAPVSDEQREFEELDFETVLAQEKADGPLGTRCASGGDAAAAAEVEPEPAPAAVEAAAVAAVAVDESVEVDASVEVESASEPDALAAKRAAIAAREAAAQEEAAPMGAASAPSIEEA